MFEGITRSVSRHPLEYKISSILHVSRILFLVPVFLVLYIAWDIMKEMIGKKQKLKKGIYLKELLLGKKKYLTRKQQQNNLMIILSISELS